MKRQPLLADRLLADGCRDTYLTRKWSEQALTSLQTAKRFVLDAQATKYLAMMVREYPRVIADAQDFAIPPYSNMWIEFPFKTYFREITGREPEGTADDVVGYLFDGPQVRTAASAQSDTKIGHIVSQGFLPIEFTLHRPMRLSEELQLSQRLGTSRMGLDYWMWGSTAEALQVWDAEGLRALRENHTLKVGGVKDDLPPELLSEAFKNSAGELRNIVALLLYLNRTHDIQKLEEFKAVQGFIGNKLKVYGKHNVISLKLDPTTRIKRLVAGSGVKHRLHDVRGHFCHDQQARKGCQHGSELFGDFGDHWDEYQPLKWKCRDCGGKRWWRKEHARGSLDEGVVVSEYAVTR